MVRGARGGRVRGPGAGEKFLACSRGAEGAGGAGLVLGEFGGVVEWEEVRRFFIVQISDSIEEIFRSRL